MENNTSKNLKIVLVFAGIVLLSIVGYFIYTTIINQGKVAVNIVAAPSSASITLNDEKISPGTVYLKAGQYKIKATKEGFADFSSTVSIIDKLEGQSIPIPLTPVSDEANKWATDNQDAYTEVESKAGESAQKQGESFREKNPIVKQLPTDSLLYSIGYRSDPDDPTGESIILEIDAGEGYRQAAIYQIVQWGYNPADFKINFNNYKNPFSL
ncbi:MAG TPA: PEGA domain-containing protein [Candidatus Saccharimonadales bacterium]|nr:PEGA domain-containing protein [Candidatus Saccharimonadales bacterium]